jgi:uncharacterized membrane protein
MSETIATDVIENTTSNLSDLAPKLVLVGVAAVAATAAIVVFRKKFQKNEEETVHVVTDLEDTTTAS